MDADHCDLVGSKTVLACPAIDHWVTESGEMPGSLPDLRVHDDRAVESNHGVRRGRAGERRQVVMVGDIVIPPSVFDVPLQLDTEGAVVPEAIDPPVDL